MLGTTIFQFENFVLDTGRGVLLRDGEEVPLRRQSFEVLVYLVRNEGRLVTREELLSAVWPGKVVTDASITQCLVDIRAALDDTEHEKIRTLTRRGYRFELPVRKAGKSSVEEISTTDSGSTSRASRTRSAWAWIAAATSAVLVMWWIAGDRGQMAPAPSEDLTDAAPVIAALPFENLSPDAQGSEFVDGFHDLLMTELSRYPDVHLIARWSINALPREIQSPEQLRELLNADLALTGSVARDSERILFTLQLHDTQTGRQEWAQAFDQRFDADALISLQQTVAESIAREAMRAVKGRNEIALATSPSFPQTSNLEAYQHYLNGSAHARRIESGEHTLELLDASRYEFEAAMAADPEWAPPYAALGRVLHFVASSATVPDAWRESQELIERALALAPEYGPALASLGYLQFRWHRDFAAAERAYLKSREAGESMANWGLALLYSALGYIDASLAHFRAAIAADPLNPVIRRQYAWRLECDGQWALAAETLAESTKLEDDPEVQRYLAYAEIRAGNTESGLARWHQYRDGPSDLDVLVELALGNTEAARDELERRLSMQPLPPPRTAELALELGEREHALSVLEQRAASDPDSLRHMMCEQSVRALEGQPRFDRLLTRLGLRGPGVPPEPL